MESDGEDIEDINENEENEESEEKSYGINEETKSIMKLFNNLKNIELHTNNTYYNKINSETQNINLYLLESIKKFHELFNSDLLDFDDALKHLEKISIPNKCVCAGVIETIPGWRCVDCSKYENAIYCTDCFKKSKHLHKDHLVYFLYSSGGMCDCGDPDSLELFCPDHSGPFSEQNQIDEYISKVFQSEVLNNLKLFFDEFFLKFSKYLILTEKFELFFNENFKEKFDNIKEEEQKDLFDEKNDVRSLKDNFCLVFQNLVDFLRLISQKNLGMLHLLAIYFMKNHLEGQKLEDDYLTNHKCIQVSQNDINIFNADGQNHICGCPFLRLLMSNWREEIKSKDNENEEFLLSFPHNLPLKRSFCIIFFFLFKINLLNNNGDILFNRNQFYAEDFTQLIAIKSKLIEETYEVFYNYLKKYIKSNILRDEYGLIVEEKIKNIKIKARFMETDTKYYSKPKMKDLMNDKIILIKTMIDCICLIHNELEFKSIVPHPVAQQKRISIELIDIEITLLSIMQEINLFIDWNRYENIKEIFRYIINKILNQEKEGIKTLKEKEYSFHLCLYRCFSLIINCFCFNYGINNNVSITKGIEYVKNNFFISNDEIESFVQIIFYDYFRFFGFLAGCNYNCFNYYDALNNYPFIYFNDKRSLKVDFTLLKYLFVLGGKNLDIDYFLRQSNIEDVYSSFDKVFFSKEILTEENDNNTMNDNNNEDKMIIEEDILSNENITHENFGNFEKLKKLFKKASNSFNADNQLKKIDFDCIMQWKFLLELLIIFLKDDSTPYWNLMRFYEETVSSQTKRELFNKIKKNEFAMEDLRNILKEKIIHEMIANDNLINLRKLKKNVENYLQLLFDENEFNKVLDELTLNKMDGETKIFFVKDICLNYLDMNYYINPKNKSKAQRYILDFKKDVIKLSNNYFFNPSKLTFDLFKISYERILLNRNNFELIIKVIDRLFSNNQTKKEYDIKSIKNSLLPTLLNYLSIFSIINTKSFIEFKLENKDLINELSKILSESLKNNKSNEILEKDFQKNIKELINKLNYFDIIYSDINEDLSKLNEYDYNTKYIDFLKLRKNNDNKNTINIANFNDENELNQRKEHSKNLKNKLKNKIKLSSNKFLENLEKNEEIQKEFNELNNLNKESDKKENDSKEEIMCFFCRNPILLNSFEKAYGKTGQLITDYFYINSVKATLKNELSKMKLEQKNKYENLLDSNYNNLEDRFGRIISCGHYFHDSCFKEGCAKYNFRKIFNCPICLKKQNILIPPLNNFQDKYNFLKSGKIQDLFDYNNENEEKEIIEESNLLFKDIIFDFLNNINILDKFSNEPINYKIFLDKIFNNFKGIFNFYENVFYFEGTTFHKQQQIDTIQNIILCLRYLMKIKHIQKKEIIDYIIKEILDLLKGSSISEEILLKFEVNYYNILFQKILLSLCILFNFEEISQIINSLISIFLPYFLFGYYLRYIIVNEINLNDVDVNHFNNYLKNNNQQIIEYFHSFMEKFAFIKLIMDFSDKKTDGFNSINQLNNENLFSFIGLDKEYRIFLDGKNEINFEFLFLLLPNTFNLNDIIFKEFRNEFDYSKIINLLIVNFKICNSKMAINKEFIINFSPIKFDFIHLDNNLFDWIERTLEQKCINCKKTTKYDYICLVCGNKICHTKSCNNYFEHVRKCGGNSSIFIDMDNMKSIVFNSDYYSQHFFPLYVNENGVGPNGYEIGKEYKLSQEKIKLAIKNYACDDFIFKQK